MTFGREKKLSSSPLHGLADGFSKINAAVLELEVMDLNIERCIKVEREMS